MLQIMDFQIDLKSVEFNIARGHPQVDDIGLVITENPCDLTQCPGPIVDDDT